MQVAQSYQAVISPCRSCPEFKRAKKRNQETRHPDCISMCQSANKYLKAIGEPPHIPEKHEDLSKLYPPKPGCNFIKTYKLCSKDEYQEAHRRLVEILKTWQGKRAALAEKIGISVTLLNSIIRGCEQRTSESTYLKIMGFTYGTDATCV